VDWSEIGHYLWHFVAILLLGLIGIWIGQRSRRPAHAGDPSGFGGWLLVLVVGQSIAPFASLADLHFGLGWYRGYPNAQAAELIQTAVSLCIFAIQLVVAIVMYEKMRSFPHLFFYQWLAITALSLVNLLAISALLPFSPFQLLDSEAVGHPIVGFAAAGIGVLYLRRSQRVRNTFVN
jgi:hypothetical protein